MISKFNSNSGSSNHNSNMIQFKDRIPTNCYVCKVKFPGFIIDKNKDLKMQHYTAPVILACNCNISICRLCALKQLAFAEDTYSSPITCPHCYKETSQGIRINNNQIEYSRGYCSECKGIIYYLYYLYILIIIILIIITIETKEDRCKHKNGACAYGIENFHAEKIAEVRRSNRNRSKLASLRVSDLLDKFSDYRNMMEIIKSLPTAAQRLAVTRLYLDSVENNRANSNADSFDVFPLGPLERVKLQADTYLQKAIDFKNGLTKDLEQIICSICMDDGEDVDVNGEVSKDSKYIIKLHCNCPPICKSCYFQTISQIPFTYENVLGPCPTCKYFVRDKDINESCRLEEDKMIADACKHYGGMYSYYYYYYCHYYYCNYNFYYFSEKR